MRTPKINIKRFNLRDFGILQRTIPIFPKKSIALVAHDNKKDEPLEWATFHRKLLTAHSLYATGTTGTLLMSKLGLDVTNLESGPLGGDQQIGSRISDGKIDFLVFFWDPLEPQPHDPDVRALLRIAVVWNAPMACNRASADFLISSALMSGTYATNNSTEEKDSMPFKELLRMNLAGAKRQLNSTRGTEQLGRQMMMKKAGMSCNRPTKTIRFCCRWG